MAKKILFVAWDGPYVTYLEGLFAPIFARVSRNYGHKFHIVHFTWSMPTTRLESLTALCEKNGLGYTNIKVKAAPLLAAGKIIALILGTILIRRFIKANQFDIVIPRSTMPARMVLAAIEKGSNIRIIYDADGLPIEERVDFAGLKVGSFRYSRLKRIERNILRCASAVLTRTAKAADLLSTVHGVEKSKFHRVINARDSEVFRPDANTRHLVREELGISETALVLVYCGSIGPQYGFEQMMRLHEEVRLHSHAYLLLLVNNPRYRVPGLSQDSNVIVRSTGVADVPRYLAAADIGLALRRSEFSMLGVSPIKLAEYLLCGLPIIASSNIGDTNSLFRGQEFVYLVEDFTRFNYSDVVAWIETVRGRPQIAELARSFGCRNFDVEAGASSYDKAIRSVT